ncbi:MAG TPA: EAL domain-containing protein [Granulicella sp.]|jgi:diguanylate cyclase (GGDEF)-like protein|nr:EAL domain-containing protein [Granulicella sp.]
MSPIVRGNPLPMWIYDRRTMRFLEVSEGAVRQYGFTREEFLEMTIRELRPTVVLLDGQDIAIRGRRRGRLWTHVRKNGSPVLVQIRSNALVYNGRVARLVVASDVSDSLNPPAELRLHDRATGMAHPWLLEQRAREVFASAQQTKRRVAIVRLELDQVEQVRERFGAIGLDVCLKQVETWLRRRVRGMDTVARTGEKEFTLILAELADDFDLYRVATALLQVFAQPASVEGVAVPLSASLGIAVYPEDEREFDRLCRAASVAMLRAKESEGYRIAMFSTQGRERTELDLYMREAMRQRSFVLHYQPVYSPEGEIRALEALLRLPREEDECGFVAPDRFVPIAEETGLIEPLGMWVIEEASRQMKAWRDEFGVTARIAVNVSPLQLRGKDFAANALEVMRRFGGEPSRIEFEITERAVLEFDEVSQPMQELAEAGITFAVDDFGTGYSSLQHLHRLPISVLKIDRSFVQRVDAPRGSEAIIEAMVSMAHSLGMRVVAEGVETEEQRASSLRLGCDSIQGFLHSRPVAAAEVPELMGWKCRE